MPPRAHAYFLLFFRNDRGEILQNHKLLPLPTSQSPPHPLQPPPPRSHDGSSSSGPSEPGVQGELGVRGSGSGAHTARRSNSSDVLLDRATTSSEEEGAPGLRGGLSVSKGRNACGAYRSSEIVTDGRMKMMNGHGEAGGRGGRAGRGSGGYNDILLDYVWGKQQKMLQRQQSQTNARQSITSQHSLHYNSYSPHQPPAGAPPTHQGHLVDQRRVKVTRTKSCGPFLSVQQSQAECFPDTHNPSQSTIQPDPHPHLLPPRPSQLPTAAEDGQLEEATRSLHKALALEGKRTSSQTRAARFIQENKIVIGNCKYFLKVCRWGGFVSVKMFYVNKVFKTCTDF